uniref:Aminotransferase-like plant mobile domain-containing protein n=1 Tax=Hordeum vulgare subsp. vulgare TaxID=112509 RepID=A0A8I6XU40_HORVV
MFQPDKYPGLDEFYEQKHRAVLVERGEVPPVLRLRGHNPNESLLYDPRYEPYFRRMDLLQFVLNFKGTPSRLNATTLTALTDRWSPETHSFHLPLGEMTITLEDIGMITGLPIEGRALTGKVRSNGWRQRVAALVGVEPEPWTNEARKDLRPSGVLFSWIQRYFRKCPRDASPLVVERFARAYLWNLLTQVVFPDGTGDTASWMFLDPLRDWDVKWSWGSAALAFLYRQLDGSCMRSKPTSTLGAMGRYKAYISELDMLTYEQVNWRPYTLFGVQQRTPPDYVETSVQLHKTNRQTNKSVINWEEHHMIWVDMETVGAHLDYGPLHDRVGTELWRCINDSNVALGRAPSSQTDGRSPIGVAH